MPNYLCCVSISRKNESFHTYLLSSRVYQFSSFGLPGKRPTGTDFWTGFAHARRYLFGFCFICSSLSALEIEHIFAQFSRWAIGNRSRRRANGGPDMSLFVQHQIRSRQEIRTGFWVIQGRLLSWLWWRGLVQVFATEWCLTFNWKL